MRPASTVTVRLQVSGQSRGQTLGRSTVEVVMVYEYSPSATNIRVERPMTAITKSVDLDRRGRVAVLTVNNPPVNALSQHVRQGLYEGLKQAISDSAVQAIVIVCAGRTFIAGADITEFGKPP